MEILEDNKISLILSQDPKSQNYIKYINMIYHNIWELMDDGELEIE